jgi:hypothetical protein
MNRKLQSTTPASSGPQGNHHAFSLLIPCNMTSGGKHLPVTICATDLLACGVTLEPRSAAAEKVCRSALYAGDKVELEVRCFRFGARVVSGAPFGLVSLHWVDVLRSLAKAMQPVTPPPPRSCRRGEASARVPQRRPAP